MRIISGLHQGKNDVPLYSTARNPGLSYHSMDEREDVLKYLEVEPGEKAIEGFPFGWTAPGRRTVSVAEVTYQLVCDGTGDPVSWRKQGKKKLPMKEAPKALVAWVANPDKTKLIKVLNRKDLTYLTVVLDEVASLPHGGILWVQLPDERIEVYLPAFSRDLVGLMKRVMEANNVIPFPGEKSHDQ